MSYIEKLLDGKKVEWKPCGEVVSIQRGRRLVKSELEELGNYAVFQNSMTPLGYYHESNVQADTTFIISAGAAGEIGYSCVEFWAADDVYYFITPKKLTSKFLYYFLLTQQTQISGQVRRASVPRLSKVVFERMLIPIPPLFVQNEIVRTLDKFTELTTELAIELTTELAARKKQYSYYRETMLSFDEGEVEWKVLGEVMDMRAGQHISASNISKTQNSEYPFPCFGGNGIRGYVIKNSHSGAHLLIGRQGALCGNVQRFNGMFYATEHAVVVTCKGEIHNGFAFHLLTLMNLNQYASKSAQPGLAVGRLETLKIPILPFEEQERIASILDKFDTLTTSISEGLSKEVELRKKQYEYYRDLLLTFPKNNIES